MANTVEVVEQVDPQTLVQRAKAIQAMAHGPSRRFYASLLLPDIDRALEGVHAETARAVSVGEERSFRLGQIKERLTSMAGDE